MTSGDCYLKVAGFLEPFSTPEWGCEVPMRPIRTPSTLRSLYTLLESIVAAAVVLIYPK